MPLSVPSSNSGPGLSSLLRQARPAKGDEATTSPPAEQPTTVSLRPLGRSGIDSTQRGTAQITAALTVYMSQLGGSDETPVRTGSNWPAPAAASTPRSSAADLLRTLDASRSAPTAMRLTA